MGWEKLKHFLRPDSFKVFIVLVFLSIFVVLSFILVYYNMFASSVLDLKQNRELEFRFKGEEMPAVEQQKFEQWFDGIEKGSSDTKLAYTFISPIASDENVRNLQSQLLPSVMPSISWIQVFNIFYWYFLACLIGLAKKNLLSRIDNH